MTLLLCLLALLLVWHARTLADEDPQPPHYLNR